MLDTDLVWARDPHEGYIQGKIGELGAHEYEIIPSDGSGKKRTCPIEDVFPSCESKSDNDDNCKSTLMKLNTSLTQILQARLLHFIPSHNQSYSIIGNISRQ